MATASSQSEGTWSFRDEEGNQITLPESKINEYMNDDNMRDLVLDLIVQKNEGGGGDSGLDAMSNVPDASSGDKAMATMNEIKSPNAGPDVAAFTKDPKFLNESENQDSGPGLMAEDGQGERILEADKPELSSEPKIMDKQSDQEETPGYKTVTPEREQAFKRLYDDADQYTDEQAAVEKQVPPIKVADVNAANFNVWKEQTTKGLIDHLVEKVGYDPAETSVEQLYEKKWAEIGEQINQETFDKMFPDDVYQFGFERLKDGEKKQRSYDAAIQAQKSAIYKAVQKEHAGTLATRDKAVRDQEKMFKELQGKLNRKNLSKLKEEEKYLGKTAKIQRDVSAIQEQMREAALGGENTDEMKSLRKQLLYKVKQMTIAGNIEREKANPTEQVGISQEKFDQEKIQKIKLPTATMKGIDSLVSAPKDKKAIANFVKTAMYRTQNIKDSVERSQAIKQIVIELAKEKGISIKTIFPEDSGKKEEPEKKGKKDFKSLLTDKKKPPGKKPPTFYQIKQPKDK